MAVSFKLNKINKKHLSNIVIVTALISLVLFSVYCFKGMENFEDTEDFRRKRFNPRKRFRNSRKMEKRVVGKMLCRKLNNHPKNPGEMMCLNKKTSGLCSRKCKRILRNFKYRLNNTDKKPNGFRGKWQGMKEKFEDESEDEEDFEDEEEDFEDEN